MPFTTEIARLVSWIRSRLSPRPLPSVAPDLSPAIEPPIVQLKQSPGLRMIVHSKFDRYISPQIATTGSWEPFETELVQRFLRPGDGFVDIGANIGWYTIIAAARVGSKGQIYAFEPGAENFELAARNVALNGFANVRLECAAVSDRPGSAALFLSAENLGDHRLYESAEGRGSETVAVTSLDAYFADKPGPIRLIKMDTQGSEAKILAGMPCGFLEQREVAGLIIEYWPFGLVTSGSDPDMFIDLLGDTGLKFFLIREERRLLEPISLSNLAQLARDELKPEGQAFVNLLGLPTSQPEPDWLARFIQG